MGRSYLLYQSSCHSFTSAVFVTSTQVSLAHSSFKMLPAMGLPCFSEDAVPLSNRLHNQAVFPVTHLEWCIKLYSLETALIPFFSVLGVDTLTFPWCLSLPLPSSATVYSISIHFSLLIFLFKTIHLLSWYLLNTP